MPPLIRPFQEAYDFQVRRTAVLPADYAALPEDLRPLAQTVAGLERYDSVAAIDRLLEESILGNKTMSDAVDQIGNVIDEHGGLVLSPQRLELIHWNAMVTVNSAGAYRQTMEFAEDRPVFWYYGPDEGPNHHISEICRPIHKIKVRYDDPILKHFWGPNHHHCYHAWESMTEEEAGSDIYASPEGQEYPVINGVEARPAPGFDFDPAKSMVDDRAFAQGVASLKNIAARKAASDYGLAGFGELDADALEAAPKITKAIAATPKAANAAWARFRSELGMETADGVWSIDYAGDGVRINKDSFDELLGADRENARYLSFVTSTIGNPTESWWVPYETDEGTAYARRYLKVFVSGKNKRIGVVIDTTPPGIAAGDGRTPGAWMWRMKVVNPLGDELEQFRAGLLAHTKGKRG